MARFSGYATRANVTMAVPKEGGHRMERDHRAANRHVQLVLKLVPGLELTSRFRGVSAFCSLQSIATGPLADPDSQRGSRFVYDHLRVRFSYPDGDIHPNPG